MNDGLIKRSDAAEVVYKALKTPPLKGALTDTMSLAIALVQDISSADRPQGEWKNHKDEHYCTNCGEVVIGDWYDEYDWYTYCPNCGARMKGADDEL